MQLLTLARNWRLASAATSGRVDLVRFTLPFHPVTARYRLTVTPTGTVGQAYMTLVSQQRGVGGTEYAFCGVDLTAAPLGQWVQSNSQAVSGSDSPHVTALGPWDLRLGIEPGDDTLTGPIAGRVEFAYWQ